MLTSFDTPPPLDMAFPVEWEGCGPEASPRQYLVKKLLPARGVATLSGVSGAGKSFVAIDLAGSLATRNPFFGQRVKRGGTLILASEAYDTQKDRLKAYRNGKLKPEYEGASLAGLPPPFPPQFPIAVAPLESISKQNIDAIIETIEIVKAEMLLRFDGQPLRLIIIDTFAAAMRLSDENSSTEVTEAMKLLQRMATELDVLVMPVVHHGKGELGGVRGSSAFEASADVRLTVQYTKSTDGHVSGRNISLGKSRYDETGWCHEFQLMKHCLGFDDDGDDITSCYVVDLGEPEEKISNTKKNKTVKHRENLLVAIDKAVAEAGDPTGDDGWVPTKDVRAHFAAIEGNSDPGSDAFRKQCERAERDAEEDGEIEFMGSRSEKRMRRTKVPEPTIQTSRTEPIQSSQKKGTLK